MATRPRQPRGRLWLGAGFAGLALLAGLIVASNWSTGRAYVLARQLAQAASDDARHAYAARLLQLNEAGWEAAEPLLRSDSPAADALLHRIVEQVEGAAPDYAPLLLDASSRWTPANQARLVPILPRLAADDARHPLTGERCRAIIRCGLNSPRAEIQRQAVRLAVRPELELHADLLPLLQAPDPAVRGAVLLALGPATDRPSGRLDTEQLFPFLHDPDPDVRQLCRAALITRGLDDEQLHFARLLRSPRVTDRLKLLQDLPSCEASRLDAWLERLSHDPEPAVRLGTARLAAEEQLGVDTWLRRLAQEDADPTVRRYAAYYRQLAGRRSGMGRSASHTAEAAQPWTAAPAPRSP